MKRHFKKDQENALLRPLVVSTLRIYDAKESIAKQLVYL